MSIDRERENEPYHINNIKMITLGDNVRKYQAFAQAQIEPAVPDGEYPF